MSTGETVGLSSSTPKSEATRQSILDGARAAFAAKGYAGTTVRDITERSRVTRAGFYYYFRDKREVFLELGTQTYRETVRAASSLADLPKPAALEDVREWVDDWFSYLDDHGAYVIRSAEDAPTDADFQAAVRRLQHRTAAILGGEIVRRSTAELGASGGVGLTLMAMLERSWLLQQMPAYPARRDETSTSAAAVVLALLR